MIMLWTLILLSLKVIDHVCGEPTLMPPTLYVCPNEIVTYTCYDRQIVAMDWIAEPYIPAYNPIKYVASTATLDVDSQPINRNKYLSATLVNITQRNLTAEMADLTTSLTVITDGLKNGTIITCQTFRIINGILSVSRSTSTLYFADAPYWKKRSITYHQKNETYFTAVLQLGDIFDGGGASIVHYFVQIFKTTVEITDLTYSVDVMYNDTLYIVLLAQNCAGYSSYVITALQYEPDSSKSHGSSNLLIILSSSSAGVVMVIITAILIFCICYIKKRPRSGADSRPQQEPDYNMDNNPLYITRKKPTIKKKEPHIYAAVS